MSFLFLHSAFVPTDIFLPEERLCGVVSNERVSLNGLSEKKILK